MLERNALIPGPDGVELAAEVRVPDSGAPAPAVVCFTPYRKDDMQGANREFAVRHFVEQGYAHIHADFRGLGSSSGIASEAMSFEQAADGAAVVEWVAAQPWCDGNVGMWGVSYGGITALQTASIKPPHLRAIAPIFASFDIYEDWFYPGGCFNCLGVSTWVAQMLAMQLAPPMFQDPAGRWYDVWLERLEQSEPYIAPWRDHPARDAFWQAKTIPIEQIDVPTFLIGGWRDLFPEAMPRAYERIRAPRKLWMGPWQHVPPDSAAATAVEYLPEICRWFDLYLRNDPNGIDTEPPVTIFVQGEAAGWRHDEDWPIAGTETTALFFGPEGALSQAPPPGEAKIDYRGDPTVGIQAGLWDPRGTGLGLPLDQRPDDDRSLCFTSEPLLEEFELAGSPEVFLRLAIEEGDEVNLVVKLCDVAPDNSSALVTTGWLKARHRGSHGQPEPVPLGATVDIQVRLWATSYRVAAGHRLRASISCGDFPRIWPSGSIPRIRLSTGGDSPSLVHLPRAPSGGVPGNAPVPADASISRTPLTQQGDATWRTERDHAHGTHTVVSGDRRHFTTPGGDGAGVFDQTVRATVAEGRPDGASVQTTTRFELDMPSGGHAVIVAESRATLEGFVLNGRVELDGTCFFEKSWRA